MAVHSLMSVKHAVIIFGFFTLADAVAIPRSDCFSRCRRTNQNALNCLEKCSSVKKRSINEGSCNIYDENLYNKIPPGNANVCVQYELDPSQPKKYKSLNVSWSIPNEVKEADKANKTEVVGFWFRWIAGNGYNQTCWQFSKNSSYFILNSTFIPRKMMKCDIPVSVLVTMLPVSPQGHASLIKFFCPGNSSENRSCVHKGYSTKEKKFESVTTPASSSSSYLSPRSPRASSSSSYLSPRSPRASSSSSYLSPRSPTTIITSLTSSKLVRTSAVSFLRASQSPAGDVNCTSNVCKFAVTGGVVCFLVVLGFVLFAIKTKYRSSFLPCRKDGENIQSEILKRSKKGFSYVSYFSDDAKAEDPSKSVINFLMLSGVQTVAVNVLAQDDLQKYYTLGPRKFGELYMQIAHYVIVIVSKKYLEICDVKNNAQLDKEKRRVFEEINYIDRAQLEPCFIQPGKTVLSGENSTKEATVSFNNRHVPNKRFIAVLLDASFASKLPTWMKGWPVLHWPEGKNPLLEYVRDLL